MKGRVADQTFRYEWMAYGEVPLGCRSVKAANADSGTARQVRGQRRRGKGFDCDRDYGGSWWEAVSDGSWLAAVESGVNLEASIMIDCSSMGCERRALEGVGKG